jgi:RNA polymerase sigma-70 factor (ECF subfamily)
VLILREVLRWQAREVAELLGTSVASVNSALQRARATLETVSRETTDPAAVDAEQRALLARYLDAFERYDIASLVTLVRADP